MMVILIVSVVALVIGFSLALLVRDLRRLHRGGKHLTGSPISAGGVSDAGMTFGSSIGTH